MDVFNLYAKIVFDSADYEKGLEKASKNTSKIGAKIGKAFSTIAKAGVVAIGTASAAVGKLVDESVAAYSNYEQLVGGVETLFGAGGLSLEEYADRVDKTVDEISSKYASLMAAQSDVMNNARNAYKNAGMSANEYMENVSGFAAALNNSLGGDTEAAASIADMAINDMADNANKMGSSMESIQNAYQGFAKQDYTMLDNLKLGYGGTRSELERLLADAEKISGKKYDISSLADIIEAIHVIQDEIGITGTTVEEARKTIQGSLNMAKAAWANLVVGIADDTADFDQLVDNFVESVVIASENILPRVGKALNGVAKLVERLFPMLAARIPDLIRQMLPALLTGAIGLVTTLVGEMPAILSALWDAITATWATLATEFPILGDIESAVSSAIGKMSEALAPIKTAFQPVIDAVSGVIDGIKEWIESGQAAEDVADGISSVFDTLVEIIGTVSENIAGFVTWLQSGSAGAEVLKAAVIGITSALVAYKAATIAVTAVQKAWSVIQTALTAGQNLLNVALNANPIGIIITLVAALVAAFIYLWNNCEGFRNFWINLWEGIKTVFAAVVAWLGQAAANISEFFTNAWATIKSVWSGVTGFFSGIWSGIKMAFSAVGSFFGDIFRKAKENVQKAWSNIASFFSDIWAGIKGVFSDAVSIGKKIVDDIRSGIKSAWEGLKSWFKGIWNSLFGGLKANVTVNRSVSGGATNGSHANGLDYVPFDGYIAELHKGEMILTADEAKDLRNGSTSGEYKTKTVSAAESSLSKALGGMKIYLDSGELVGGISSKMDKSLGTIKTVRARYAT